MRSFPLHPDGATGSTSPISRQQLHLQIDNPPTLFTIMQIKLPLRKLKTKHIQVWNHDQVTKTQLAQKISCIPSSATVKPHNWETSVKTQPSETSPQWILFLKDFRLCFSTMRKKNERTQHYLVVYIPILYLIFILYIPPECNK